jgi:DNA-directed RNA polymerase specialized sigma24 family protein
MLSRSILVSIDAVSTSLPFGVDDYAEVNKTYRRWVEQRKASDRRLIDVWTYCFVQRFFALQFLRSPEWTRSDADRLVDITLQRLRASSYQLRNPERYTSWVASACRNAYLTYVRGRRTDGLEDPDMLVAEPDVSSGYDVAAMYGVLELGISRLPVFLRATARLRLIEGTPYGEISSRTGRSIPTLRAYVNRALDTLRSDPQVRRVFDEMRVRALPK